MAALRNKTLSRTLMKKYILLAGLLPIDHFAIIVENPTVFATNSSSEPMPYLCD